MEKKNVTIVIATTSKDKIEGIKTAFIQFYPEEAFDLKIYATKVESGVSEQPFGNDTYQGAINRINNIREKYEQQFKEQGINIDFYVSCEAGIDDTNKTIINGKVSILYASEQVVCIYNPNNDSYTFGKSSAWTLPQKDIEEIINTNLDIYLRKRGCTGLHDVGNGNYITRKDAVIEGTRSAIASSLFIERSSKYKDEQGNNIEVNEK